MYYSCRSFEYVKAEPPFKKKNPLPCTCDLNCRVGFITKERRVCCGLLPNLLCRSGATFEQIRVLVLKSGERTWRNAVMFGRLSCRCASFGVQAL